MEAKPHACAIRLIMRGWLPGIVSQSRGMLRCVQTAEEPGGCRVRGDRLLERMARRRGAGPLPRDARTDDRVRVAIPETWDRKEVPIRAAASGVSGWRRARRCA